MKKLLILVCILNYLPALAQNQLGLKNLWLLGYTINITPYDKPHIDFISGQDSVYMAQRLNGQRGTDASMNDSSGNLLFYTNGLSVYNREFKKMINGDGLITGSSVTGFPDGLPIKQGAIAIPKPGSDSLFYLIHTDLDYNPIAYVSFEIYLTIINMKGDSGRGVVITKSQKIIQNDTIMPGKFTCCKHANGRDWWFVCHKAFTDEFYMLLITPDTIIKNTQHIGSIRLGATGSSCFSPDGSRYVLTDFLDQTDLFDFDRCTGLFSNWRYIPQIDSLYPIGAAFSASSRYLYLAGGNRMVQFDCTVPNIISTIDTVAYYDGYYAVYPAFPTDFFRAYIATDNKIYVNSTSSVLSLHVIDQPDSGGVACNVLQHAITLPSWNAGALVNHPNYFLGPVVGSVCDSLSLGITDNVYDKNMLLTVNPNPAKNSFYLNYNLPTGKNATLYVYNTLGNLIHKQLLYGVNNSLLIHCSTWPQGMYYLKVVMDKSEHCGYAKVIINR